MEMMSRIIFFTTLFMSFATSYAFPVSYNKGTNHKVQNLSPPPPPPPSPASPSHKTEDAQYFPPNFKAGKGQKNPNFPRKPMTCDWFPRVCRGKGSPGPDCCHKRCVDVMTDSLNCGWCGRRCNYGQACCGGECVNIMFDPKNCGGCKKRCNKGSVCRYGMCSYAY